MTSALGDASQHAKKKLATTYGNPTGAKARLPHAASSSQTKSQPSQPTSGGSSQGAVKDIYDYDFVDDETPPTLKPAAKVVARHVGKQNAKQVAKPMAKPRPDSSSKPARNTQESPASDMLGPITFSHVVSPKAKATITHQSPSTVRSASTLANAVESTRGTKRKPEPALSHRHTLATTQPKKSQQTPSVASPPTVVKSRAFGKATALGSSLSSASTSHQRTPKTPPQGRTQTAFPRRRVSPATVVATARLQAAQSSHHVPFRTLKSHASNNNNNNNNNSSSSSSSDTNKLPQQLLPSHKLAQTPQSLSVQLPAQRKRRRLIDTLAAQRDDDSEEDEEGEESNTAGTASKEGAGVSEDDDDSSLENTSVSRHQCNVSSTSASDDRGTHMDLDTLITASPGKASIAPSTPATVTRRITARRPGVKFTYNLERTMLAEEPVALGGPQGSDLSALESLLPEPEPKLSLVDVDDDIDGSSQGAIQSIHELRQAGANSRFADELADIMDRVGSPSVGKPSSVRRSALLEMVQKLQEKSFTRQFRDQGAETKLFRDVGQEADVVSGYALSCIGITLLANGSASYRLLRELRVHNIKSTLSKLLENDTDVVVLARDRKTNVSNHMRQQLTALRGTMQKLAIWKPAPGAPSQLSPRTVALKALHMLAQQLQAQAGGAGGLDENDGALSPALTKQLFDIVSSSLRSAYDAIDGDESTAEPSLLSSGLSRDAEAVDLHLVLSLLEMHSVVAMQSDIRAEWTRGYIPIVADALAASLEENQKNQHRLNELELLVLKLAMNTANNTPEAAHYYVEKGLLRRLAELGSTALAAVVQSIKTGEKFLPEALDELLLVLGVMINFSENDVLAGKTLMQGNDSSALFDQLVRAFLDGRAITAEADSEEKTQLNVAFAYLSILLGYLCLHEPIYEAFRRLSPSGTIGPVLESIRQFILVHDQLSKTDSSEGAEMNQFTTRLRALADELEMRA